MTTDRISLSISNGVADVRLNRPDKLNALDPAMFSAIADIGAQLKDNPKVRAVVLSGEGQAFCAGLDIERLIATTEGESILPFADLGQRTHGIANFAQHLVWLWRELPVPVIAAVHGVAFGGGLQIASGADVRIAAPGTRLSAMEMKWGIVPDMAGFALWAGMVRTDHLRELAYTAREFTAEEGLGYGFVTRIADDPHTEAMALARAIAGRNPHAVRAAKRLANLEGDAAAILDAETEEQILLLRTPNQIEAVMANMQKRAPIFTD